VGVEFDELEDLWQTKPWHMESQMMIAMTTMIARTISFTFMFSNHILRRSRFPCRWKTSACQPTGLQPLHEAKTRNKQQYIWPQTGHNYTLISTEYFQEL
jgi:hypothetical protein